MVLPRYRSVLFVHGCFWHQHPGCHYAAQPASNAEFWSDKLARNRTRFEEQSQSLQAAGWQVFVIWECETRLEGALDATAAGIAHRLGEQAAVRRAK